jgi:hypothetical protein
MLNELLGEQNVTEAIFHIIPEKKDEGGELDGSAAGSEANSGNAGAGQSEADSNDQVDLHGVTFDGDYCGKSADPFYGTGKRKGQWKKRRGVDDAVYDAWYLTQIPTGDEQNTANSSGEDEQINTAGAFGNQQADNTPESTPAPETCGEFMGWVSNKQAAKLITQEDIGEAYATAGIAVTDLFTPDEAAVRQHVTTLYQILAVKAGA